LVASVSVKINSLCAEKRFPGDSLPPFGSFPTGLFPQRHALLSVTHWVPDCKPAPWGFFVVIFSISCPSVHRILPQNLPIQPWKQTCRGQRTLEKPQGGACCSAPWTVTLLSFET
jgi:hypothetical protein